MNGKTYRVLRLTVLTILGVMGLPGLAWPAAIEVISRVIPRLAPATGGGDSFTILPRRHLMSADGRYLVLISEAANLFPGQVDGNRGRDVFLYDRITGGVTLVSHAAGSTNTAGDSYSGSAAISADGRYVAFTSTARDLIPGLSGTAADHLYLYERETGTITLVSRKGDHATEAAEGISGSPVLSADGGYIAYTSSAPDIVPRQIQANLGTNVFLFERSSGTNTLVSRSALSAHQTGNGDSHQHTLSTDGRYIAFSSWSTDLVAGQADSNGFEDVFLYDRITGASTLVSHANGSALQASGGGTPVLSGDGRYVAFGSGATDLVSGVNDNNNLGDVFLYDRLLGAVSLVSRASGLPNDTPFGGGFSPQISADGNVIVYSYSNAPAFGGSLLLAFDRLAGTTKPLASSHPGPEEVELTANGRYVAYTSRHSNNLSGQNDANGVRDVFLYDLATDTVTLVSHISGSPLIASNADSLGPAVSADGSWIAFSSYSDNLAAGTRDNNARLDVFLHETATGVNRVVSRHPPRLASVTPMGRSKAPSVSGDGRYVAFVSDAFALIPGQLDFNGGDDVFLHDRVTRKTVLVSRSSVSSLATGNRVSDNPIISRDGNFVVFSSRATDLVPDQADPGLLSDVFLYNRLTGTTTFVSRPSGPPASLVLSESFPAAVSADGGLVVFQSTGDNLVPGQIDNNGNLDIFVFDRRTGSVNLVSHTAGSAKHAADSASFFSNMTPNGDLIGFTSFASDLVQGAQDTNQTNDAFLYERRSGKVALLSRTAASPRIAAGGGFPRLSADGRYVAFTLMTDVSAPAHIVLLDRRSGKRLQVSRPHSGLFALTGLSADGRHLLFASDQEDVIPRQADDGNSVDLFLFDRVSGQTRLVSHVPGSPSRTADRGVVEGVLSANGRYVAFVSDSTNLTSETKLLGRDVYLYDRTTEEVTLVSRSALFPTTRANGDSQQATLSAGGFVAFTSDASDLVQRDFNSAFEDVFLYIPEP